MISSTTSHLLNNISHYNLDSRIGRLLLNLAGTGIRIGERVSAKPGYCPEILDYRHYRNGDAIKDIDWKLSARQEQLLIKIREGYRQSEFLIVIDGSESMKTAYQAATETAKTQIYNIPGKGEQKSLADFSKFIRALTLAYIAGRIALKSRDRVHILWDNEKIRVDSEQILLKTLLEMEKSEKPYDFWEYQIHGAANCFILSDFFMETSLLHDFLEKLTLKDKKIFILAIQDPVEKEFRFMGKNKFQDPEIQLPGQKGWLPPVYSILAEASDIESAYRELYQNHFIEISQICKTFGIKTGKLSTAEEPFESLIRAIL
jgi:uncharacterized protein (DUF58 family)